MNKRANRIGASLLGSLRSEPRIITAKSGRRFDKGYYSATHRLSNASYERLRMICTQRAIALQQLYDEALDLWLASNSEPPIEPTPPFKKKF